MEKLTFNTTKSSESRPEIKSEENAEEGATPESALEKLSFEIDELERNSTLFSRQSFLDRMTRLLRIAATTKDPQSYKIFRDNIYLQKLKIGNKYLIQNSLDRDLHERILDYLDSIGIKTTNDEWQEIRDSFDTMDIDRRKTTLESYAHNGLLTLKTAIEKRLLKDTSSTPGDFSSDEYKEDLTEAGFGNIRGYEVTSDIISEYQFYGRNSFFQVVMERGGEEIDRVGKIPKIEAENRMRNSMLLVVNSSKIEISRKAENKNKEDIVIRDINPDEIDYLLVDKSNLSLAQEVFGHLPVKIIGVESVEASVEGLYDGSYKVPDYKREIDNLVKVEGSVWCHIARLPVDTYPKHTD